MKIKKIILLPLIAISFTSCELNLGTSGLLSNDTTSNVNGDIEPSSSDKTESESTYEVNNSTSQFENSSTSEVIDPNLVKLKVWCGYYSNQFDFINEAATKFRTLYPEIKFDFTIEVVPEPDLLFKMSSDLESSADVFHFPGDYLMQLYKQGFLHDFNTDESRIKLNSLGFSNGCLSAGQINGTQYAIPFTPNTFFMYYDSSVYTEEDVKSLTNMLKVNVSEKKSSYKYNAAIEFDNGWYGQSILYSFGASINETTGSFDNAEKGTKYLAQCVHNEKLITDYGYSNFGVDTAAVIDGIWNEAYYQEVLGSNFACAPLPH